MVKKLEKLPEKKQVKLTHKFVYALSLVSILGFLGIMSQSFFDYDLSFYVEAFLMLIIGAGLILESKAKGLVSIKEVGLTSTNFTHLITVIIGAIAVLAGIFSLPIIRWYNPSFVAIKGIISIIAIVIIIIQTWVVD
jgi:hypothetical protein